MSSVLLGIGRSNTSALQRSVAQLNPPYHNSVRSAIGHGIRVVGFFNKYKAADLWRSTTSHSMISKRRGKAIVVLPKNLNRGMIIGFGRVNVSLPGLNEVPRLEAFRKPEFRGPNVEYLNKIVDLRASYTKRRIQSLNPLDRGFSGSMPRGKRLGPPPPITGFNFEGFQSVCLRLDTTVRMHPQLGRVMERRATVAVGNGGGLVGIGTSVAEELQDAINLATVEASKKLHYIELLDGHTIYQNFYVRMGTVQLYVERRPEGTGIRCPRVLKAICELVGIRNIRVKVYFVNSNWRKAAYALLAGLLHQESLQELANRKRLHVVEFRKDMSYIPQVRASPENVRVRSPSEVPASEVMDVEELYGQMRLPGKRTYRDTRYTCEKTDFRFNDRGNRDFFRIMFLRNRYRNIPATRPKFIASDCAYPEHLSAQWAKEQQELVEKGLKPLPEGGIGMSKIAEKRWRVLNGLEEEGE